MKPHFLCKLFGHRFSGRWNEVPRIYADHGAYLVIDKKLNMSEYLHDICERCGVMHDRKTQVAFYLGRDTVLDTRPRPKRKATP